MRLIHFTKIKRSVPPVEDPLHIVRIKEKSIFLPTEIREGRIRSEVAVQEGWFSIGKIDFPLCIDHFRLI